MKRLTVDGNRDAIDQLFELITPSPLEQHGTSVIDFERILPSPSEPLQPIPESTATFWQTVIFSFHDWWSGARAARKTAMKEYFDWRETNWGCLGNAWDTEEGRQGDSLCFITTDSPPIPLMRTLSKRFPTLRITLEWIADADLTPSRVNLRNGVGEEIALVDGNGQPTGEGQQLMDELLGLSDSEDED